MRTVRVSCFNKLLFSEELFFGGADYRREFCVSKCFGLDNVIVSEGYLGLRFGRLIFRRA